MSFLQIPIQTYPNTVLGYQALINPTIAPPFSGQNNSAFGDSALQKNTTGYQNVGIGRAALLNNTTGNNNTAVGMNAAAFNITGSGNTAFGAQAFWIGTGDNNTAIGGAALGSLTTGERNTGVGVNAGSAITTGSRNSILGSYTGNQGGLDIRTLSNYVVISDGDGNPRIIVDPAGLVSAPGGFSGGGGGGALTFNNRTAAYTVVSGDLGKIVNCTSGTFTVSLTAAATLGSGFNCWVWNTGTGVITIDPNGAETIDGVPTLTLRRGEGSQIVCDGANWQTGDKKTMRGYAENISSSATRPVASADKAIAIGDTASASQVESVAIGHQSSATGFYNIAIGRANTSGTAAIAFGFETSATATSATAIGGTSASAGSKALGAGSTALGGSYASGTDSFAAAIANNTSTYGAQSPNSIAIGDRNKSTNTGGVAIGGLLNSAGGSFSLVAGTGCSTGLNSSGSMAFGNGATNTVAGKFSFAGTYYSLAFGTAQMGMMCLSNTTPGAAATVLTSNGGAASTINQLILPDATAMAFSGIVVARQKNTGGTASAAWSVSGLIRRDAGAGTTTLVTSTVTVISNVPGWTLALSADTVNGGLAVTATGAAATDVRWHVKLDSSEVTYA